MVDTILYVLMIVAVLVQFLDFVMGHDGRASRDRLADWYVYIGETDRSQFLVSAARFTDSFISYIFGPKLLSARFVVIGAAISLFFSISFVMIVLGVVEIRSNGRVWVVLLPMIFAANAALDLLALTMTRKLLRIIKESTDRMLVIQLFGLDLLVGYLAFTFSFVLTLLALDVADVLSTGAHIDLTQHFREYSLFSVAMPWVAAQLRSPILLLSIPAALWTIILLTTFGAALLLYATQPISKPLLLGLIERVAKVPGGVLKSFSVFSVFAVSIMLLAFEFTKR